MTSYKLHSQRSNCGLFAFAFFLFNIWASVMTKDWSDGSLLVSAWVRPDVQRTSTSLTRLQESNQTSGVQPDADQTPFDDRLSPLDIQYDAQTYFDNSRTQSSYLKSKTDFNEFDLTLIGPDQFLVKPKIAV